jgi:PKD repeat protein
MTISDKLPDMMRRMGRAILGTGLLVALILIGAFSANWVGAWNPLTSLFPLAAQTSGDLAMEMMTDPPAAAPGTQVTLQILLTNNGVAASTPDVTIAIPSQMSLDLQSLPAGTTFSVQTNTLSWQPLIPIAATQELRLPLSVDVADLKQPEQTITALLRDGGQTQTLTTTVWIGMPPQASVSFEPAVASVGQAVKLLANASGPGPFTQLWSLGDGRILSVNDPVVVFPATGTYQVTLQLSNPLGPVVVGNIITVVPEPVASFTVSDSTVGPGQPVSFTNTSGGQAPLAYHWDFGDGTSSQETNPIHQYAEPGSYVVRLITSNEYGQADAYGTVGIGQPPAVDISVDEVGEAGRLIAGQAFTDDPNNVIRWEMGDGRSYEGAVVQHVYWAAGDYLVTATAANDYGEVQISRWVHIEPGILFLYLPMIFSDGSSDIIDLEPLVDNLIGADEERPGDALQPLELPATLSPSEQLFAYINEARRMHGVPPTSYVYELSVAAQAHADDMAYSLFTSHTGSDGSTPPLRIRRAGYPGGYGGEATAWGVEQAIEAVKVWLNSPPHRAIILNPAATDVGVGYTLNFNAPSIWYWTAEFASMSLPVVDVPMPEPTSVPPTAAPVLQLLGPPQNSEFALIPGNNLIFTWSWSKPLQDDERFIVYLQSGRTFQIGVIDTPFAGNQYQFKAQVTSVPVSPGPYRWLVRLENLRTGEMVAETNPWPIEFIAASGSTPTATPSGNITPTPAGPSDPTPAGTSIPTATP